MKRIHYWLMAFIVVCLVGTVGLRLHWWRPTADRDTDAFMRQMAGPAQARAWREVARKREVSDSFVLQKWQAWTTAPRELSANVRVSLTGRFNAQPANEVTFAVFDSDNFARFQSGFPPILLYSAPPAQAINFTIPASAIRTGFTYALIYHPKASAQPQIPTSIPALILLALQGDTSVPPALVTAEIDRGFECFCTVQEWEKAKAAATK